MALTDSEIQRIRYELGYPNLSSAAEPMIGVHAIFDQVIKPYTLSGASTTSSTVVVAASTFTPVTLTLSSVTGFSAGNTVIVDVDARQERVTVQSLNTGAGTITVLLSLAHTGTYPVTVEGGETVIREILTELRTLSTTISELRNRAGLKQADEISFFGGGQTLASQGIDPISQTLRLREYWRDELASALSLPRLNAKNNSGGNEVGVY